MLNLSKQIFDFFHLIYQNSFKLYFIGGFSRNYILNLPFDNDFDLSINCNPEILLQILKKNTNYFPILNAIQYGTISFFIEKNKIEITSCRSDVKTFGRKAEVIFTDNFYQDSLRRDFTINAIYLNHNQEILDYHNGINDLRENKLNFIGNPELRIQEDYLRILRYFRFIGAMNLQVNMEIIEIIKQYKGNLKILSKERITDELKKISKTKSCWNTLDLMLKNDILFSLTGIKAIKLFAKHNFQINKLNYLFSYIIFNFYNVSENLKIIKNQLSLTKNETKMIDYLLNYEDLWNDKANISIETKILFQKISYENFLDIIDILQVNNSKMEKIKDLYFKIQEVKIKTNIDFPNLKDKELGDAIKENNIKNLEKIN